MAQSSRIHFFIIFLCSAAVRIVYFFQFQDNPFFDYVPRSWDQGIYYQGGLAFARGDLMAVAPILDNHFSPAYQYFLGILFLFFGEHIEVAWIGQFVLGILSTFFVYSIASHFFSRTAGLIASLFFTFYSPNWLYEGSLYRSSLIVFLELAVFRILLAAGNSRRWSLIASSAVVLGLFMQVRSNNILLFPVALYYLFYKSKAFGKIDWPQLTGFSLIVLLVCAPGLFWVKEVRGQWGLYDKSGPENLLLSNTLDHSVRTYEHNETYQEVLKSISLKTGPVLEYILETIVDHPLEFIFLYLKKTYYYFNNYEVPVTLNFYLFQEFSPILGYGIPFAILGGLGLCGAFLLWKRKGWTLLHTFLVTAFLIFLPFLVLSRYRLYSIPFLCMFSGYFMVSIQEWVKVKNLKALMASFLCLLVLGLLFRTESLPEGKIRIDDFANMGSAYLNNDEPEDDNLSINYYQRAHELSQTLEVSLQRPQKIKRLYHDYYLIRAKGLLEKNETKKGLNSLEKALSFDYSVSKTHYIYANELSKIGILEGALREGLEAFILNPESQEIPLLLGNLYSKLPYSPLWVVLHWEQAANNLEGSQLKTLNNTLTQIKNQLGLTRNNELSEKKRIIEPLVTSLPSIIPFPSDSDIPLELKKQTPKEVLRYTVILLQRLVLFPDERKNDIHLQLGIIYWKKENRLSAAVHHLEKAWDAGSRSSILSQLTKLK